MQPFSRHKQLFRYIFASIHMYCLLACSAAHQLCLCILRVRVERSETRKIDRNIKNTRYNELDFTRIIRIFPHSQLVSYPRLTSIPGKLCCMQLQGECIVGVTP